MISERFFVDVSSLVDSLLPRGRHRRSAELSADPEDRSRSAEPQRRRRLESALLPDQRRSLRPVSRASALEHQTHQ